MKKPVGSGQWAVGSGLALLVALVIAAVPLGAQCAMCYQNAAASGAQGIRALNLGILFLIVPVVSIITGIAVVAYRYRD